MKKINDYIYLIVIILSSFVFSFYSFEIYKFYQNNYSIKHVINTNTKIDVIQNSIKQGVNTVGIIPPSKIFKINNNSIYPLSGISNTLTINCNENGYWSKYISDKYGFNNNNELWENNNLHYLFIGDSMTQGSCVHNKYSIVGHLKNISKKQILNLGYSGTGPLTQLAVLSEYLNLTNPKRVFWNFSEINDFRELGDEIKNNFLLRYLNENFSQNLAKKQSDIDKILNDYFFQELRREINNLQVKKKLNLSFYYYNFKIILKLTESRLFLEKLLNIKLIRRSNYINEKNIFYFEKIVNSFKNQSLKNKSKLYFVYIPSRDRLMDPFSKSNTILNKDQIFKIVNKYSISIIDLESLFEKFNTNELESFFPKDKSFPHFNENGYKEIANYIYEETKLLNDN